MKILSAQQIREADAFTIEHEPISSINLMERAARAFTNWFTEKYSISQYKIIIICGLGNNGGDGLAIARMLHPIGYEFEVFVVNHSTKTSADFDTNLQRLQSQYPVNFINQESEIPAFTDNHLIIDALLGSGLNRSVEGLLQVVIEKINNSTSAVISVDIPSGLFVDTPNLATDTLIKATHTVSFQLPKLSFMLPQNDEFVGKWHLIKIGLDAQFIEKTPSNYFFTDNSIEKRIKHRQKFAHKGNFGHALLISGSKGMMGAAILSARGCMRTGVGKLTVHIPACGYSILQSVVPEAMTNEDADNEQVTEIFTTEFLEKFNAIGIGCGIGTSSKTVESVSSILEKNLNIPLVLDADALNILSANRSLLEKLLPYSILTPHPKEFQKLVKQTWQNDYERLEILKNFAVQHQIIVCLKGSHTAVALPNGTVHFNSTGNPNMATAGSGDVLTGVILSLLAQGYDPSEAAILGVYLHGKAGDFASLQRGNSPIIASDIVEAIRL